MVETGAGLGKKKKDRRAEKFGDIKKTMSKYYTGGSWSDFDPQPFSRVSRLISLFQFPAPFTVLSSLNKGVKAPKYNLKKKKKDAPLHGQCNAQLCMNSALIKTGFILVLMWRDCLVYWEVTTITKCFHPISSLSHTFHKDPAMKTLSRRGPH